jgi:crossover junction endodeoxyribonuclease RusA
MWPDLPLEFFVVGIPVSLQGSARSKKEWQDRVRAAARAAIPPESWAFDAARLAVSVFYFPAEPLQGDVDNRIKPILDGMRPNVVVDDALFDRVVAQRIHPMAVVTFADPSPVLLAAMVSGEPTVYIRVDEVPLEDIRL